MKNVFTKTAGIKMGRSRFDMSWEKEYTCDMGELIPVCHDLIMPGDVVQYGFEVFARTQPMAAPIMHPIYMTVHAFWCPIRALCVEAEKEYSQSFDWEDFITGGETGADAQSLPTWDVTTNTEGSLWDYLTYPLGVDNANARPVAFKYWCYGWVWNWWYRDQNIDTAIDFTTVETIQRARWEKDYFTSALPWQQLGTSPGIGTTTVWTHDQIIADANTTAQAMVVDSNASPAADRGIYVQGNANAEANLLMDLNNNSVDVDIEDFRLAFAVQRWMELSARAGSRYYEHIKAFFGEDMGDHRAMIPEYLGGAKLWLSVSEVAQSESSDATTPQGTLAGRGVIAGNEFLFKRRFNEHGVLMVMATIRPKAMYHQGIDRQDLQQTRYDFMNPMFQGLSEQEVLTREIYCDGANELTVFGYQGRFDEFRQRPSKVCGDFHADYDMWHCCRQFAAAPTLNSTFLQCDPRDDWKASSAEDGFLIKFGNRILMDRKLTYRATPGLGTL